MQAATHTGTCQVCGARQMLPYGVLAKHGYKVKFNIFVGVCPGADRKPLEQERSLADQVAHDLRTQADEDDLLAKAVRAGTIRPRQAKSGKRAPNPKRAGWDDVMVAFDDAPKTYQQEAIDVMAANAEGRARFQRSMANSIEERAAKIYRKQKLQPRTDLAPRKEIVAGTRVKLWGSEVTVLRVENRTARGVGPALNGQYVPHIVFMRNGKEMGYPTRFIRQSAIVG